MWSYSQTSRVLMHDAIVKGHGYSGFGPGRDNPAMEGVPGVGPIPRGHYTIGPVYKHEHLGPIVMNLDPMPGTNTFGRSLFRIHGNNATNDASHGCIILGPDLRKAIADSKDTTLVVTL